jgi:isopentenyl diphosphate isomerase/L-lactate dehydrogenase-like FMN-dependent dehydrogenase
MYGVAALGEVGAEHAIELLREELGQVMEQLGCKSPITMVDHSVSHVP